MIGHIGLADLRNVQTGPGPGRGLAGERLFVVVLVIEGQGKGLNGR